MLFATILRGYPHSDLGFVHSSGEWLVGVHLFAVGLVPVALGHRPLGVLKRNMGGTPRVVGSGQVVVQVDSRAEDLLEAGKVAFEAVGESDAADGLRGGGTASEGIQLEVRG